MTKYLLIYFFIILWPSICYSQKLVVKAKYVDENNQVTKIEAKYKDVATKTFYYIKIAKNHVVCITKNEKTVNDTLIVNEQYFYIQNNTNLNDKRWSTTKFILNKINEVVDYSNLEEKLRYYIVGGLPIKIEWYSPDEFSKSAMVVVEKSTFIKYQSLRINQDSSFSIYKTDSINWNHDTSEVVWTTFLNNNKMFYTKYSIEYPIVKMYENDSLRSTIEYDTKDIFLYILLMNSVYNDPFETIQLLENEKGLILRKITKSNNWESKFEIDKLGRVKKEQIYNKQKLVKVVEYEYH